MGLGLPSGGPVVMRILHVGKVCTLTLRWFWRSRAGCRMSPLLRFTGVLEVAIETVRSEIDIFVPQRVFSTLYLPSSTSDENLGRSRSAEKHMRIVLMMKGLEGPNTQDKAERFMVATGHYLEDVMATCRGVAFV